MVMPEQDSNPSSTLEVLAFSHGEGGCGAFLEAVFLRRILAKDNVKNTKHNRKTRVTIKNTFSVQKSWVFWQNWSNLEQP